MRKVTWREITEQQRAQLLSRPAVQSDIKQRQIVENIIADVRRRGDQALSEYSEKFDRVAIKEFRVDKEQRRQAWEQLPTPTRQALLRAKEQIEAFHRAQLPTALRVELRPGIVCEKIWRPIDRVGLYIPGGTAPLPSTVLMTALPARIAECPLRILCTPPGPDGQINPVILAAAELAEVDDVYRLGGAQAIAAMAFGSTSIPKVDKIFGPGNSWVTMAKVLAAQDPQGAAADMPAGPSEVLVIADASADPQFIASDLLSQAEHGTDSQVLLVTTSSSLAVQVEQAVQSQLALLSRQSIAASALEKSSIIIADDLQACCEISNQYGPEHLIIQTREARSLLPAIRNAGSVFLGAWSPESVGDYASGTNHVLPTYGWTKSFGGLSMESFYKHITVQELSTEGLMDIGPTVEQLAEVEGLDAHRNAVRLRLARLKGEPS